MSALSEEYRSRKVNNEGCLGLVSYKSVICKLGQARVTIYCQKAKARLDNTQISPRNKSCQPIIVNEMVRDVENLTSMPRARSTKASLNSISFFFSIPTLSLISIPVSERDEINASINNVILIEV